MKFNKFFLIASMFLFTAAFGCDDDDNTEPEEKQPSFQTVNGEVVLSAEHYSFLAGDVGAWELDSVREDYLDKGYMEARNAETRDVFSADLASINYVIDFKETGVYYVHLRTYADTSDENGFFATLDGTEISYGGANPSDPTKIATYIYVEKQKNRWYWFTDGGGAGMRNLMVSFNVTTTGKHTFAIHFMEVGAQLDHIWLTKEEDTTQSTMSLDLPDYNNFIVD